jgi:hypothetical protein
LSPTKLPCGQLLVLLVLLLLLVLTVLTVLAALLRTWQLPSRPL